MAWEDEFTAKEGTSVEDLKGLLAVLAFLGLGIGLLVLLGWLFK